MKPHEVFESLTRDNTAQYHQLTWGGKWSQHWVRWNSNFFWCVRKVAGWCCIFKARWPKKEFVLMLKAARLPSQESGLLTDTQKAGRGGKGGKQWKLFFGLDWQIDMNKVLSERQAEVSGRTEGDCFGLEGGSVSQCWKDVCWIHVYNWDYPEIKGRTGTEGPAGLKMSIQRGCTNLTRPVLKLF